MSARRPVATFDPEKIARALARRKVDYVMIGASAARLHGFPRLTADIDIAPSTEVANLRRLASALRDLKARVYTEGVPQGLAFSCDAETLSRARVWNLVTNGGRLDLIFEPSGTNGYADLIKSAVKFRVFGCSVAAASLGDILRSKSASNREQDRADAAIIREMLRRAR